MALEHGDEVAQSQQHEDALLRVAWRGSRSSRPVRGAARRGRCAVGGRARVSGCGIFGSEALDGGEGKQGTMVVEHGVVRRGTKATWPRTASCSVSRAGTRRSPRPGFGVGVGVRWLDNEAE
jgi:hypothetical protein